MELKEKDKKIVAYFNNMPPIHDEIIEGYGRVYHIENESYPSVTTFLGKVLDKSWLLEWENRIGKESADKITEESCLRGTSMHDLSERYLKKTLIIDEDVIKEKGYILFKKLRTMYLDKIIPLVQEVPLWSKKLRLAGRVDCIGYYDGILSIIDFKSSTNPKNVLQIYGYFLQTTVYALMLKEMLDIPVKQVVILIGVEKGFPQIFIRPTKDYIKDCSALIKQFNEII